VDNQFFQQRIMKNIHNKWIFERSGLRDTGGDAIL
jgi:hypothetical protein